MQINPYILPGLSFRPSYWQAKVEIIAKTLFRWKAIKSNKRDKKEYVAFRHAIRWTVHKKSDLSLKEIGWIFNKDHSTIHNSIKVVNHATSYPDSYPEVIKELEDIMKLV